MKYLIAIVIGAVLLISSGCAVMKFGERNRLTVRIDKHRAPVGNESQVNVIVYKYWDF